MKSKSVKNSLTLMCLMIVLVSVIVIWRYFNFKYQHYDFHGKQEL